MFAKRSRPDKKYASVPLGEINPEKKIEESRLTRARAQKTTSTISMPRQGRKMYRPRARTGPANLNIELRGCAAALALLSLAYNIIKHPNYSRAHCACSAEHPCCCCCSKDRWSAKSLSRRMFFLRRCFSACMRDINISQRRNWTNGSFAKTKFSRDLMGLWYYMKRYRRGLYRMMYVYSIMNKLRERRSLKDSYSRWVVGARGIFDRSVTVNERVHGDGCGSLETFILSCLNFDFDRLSQYTIYTLYYVFVLNKWREYECLNTDKPTG